MSDKAIFSEGLDLTLSQDGTYAVTDRATGLPIAHVRSYSVEPIDVLYSYDGPSATVKRTVELDIDTGEMRCHLVLESDTSVSLPELPPGIEHVSIEMEGRLPETHDHWSEGYHLEGSGTSLSEAIRSAIEDGSEE